MRRACWRPCAGTRRSGRRANPIARKLAESPAGCGRTRGLGMSEERVLREAAFDDAVKYYVISTTIALSCTIVGIPLLLIFVPLTYLFRKIEYDNIQCTLYERTLVVKRGVFNKVEKTIPLDKITDLAIRQGPIMRLCKVEAIMVETAGQSSGIAALVFLVGIRDAKGFRNAVLKQRDRLEDGGDEPRPTRSASSPTIGDTDNATALLRDIRDSLARIEQRLDQP
ncbi:MAG: PH domain-containing protein [Phycisphaerales bacterium]|nr:MAG: PH domain-containing protein [Phycisphaerales bacterium]